MRVSNKPDSQSSKTGETSQTRLPYIEMKIDYLIEEVAKLQTSIEAIQRHLEQAANSMISSTKPRSMKSKHGDSFQLLTLFHKLSASVLLGLLYLIGLGIGLIILIRMRGL